MKHFIELDQNNVVRAILSTSNPEGLPPGNFIEIAARDESLHGRQYDPVQKKPVAQKLKLPAATLSPPPFKSA